ncbi:phytoene desaturase family protein [Embleya sp. NPDC059259]|uniref:phytoene desaturase family protein n=1 Tax=unclassified Embleya TaxID=2699296 RepID=UPI00368D3B24
MARIVVVGAGMGGLAVAARLATLRHEVTICERSSTTGGASGSIVRDGFTFTTGPGLLTLPAVYRDLFLKTGAAIEDVVDLVPIATATRESFAAAHGPRTVVDIPNASRSGTHDAFESGFGPGAGDDWQRLLHRAGEMWGVTRKSHFEAPLLADPAGPAERLRSAGGRADLRTTAPWRSLRSLGRSGLGDPRLRAHLERFAAEAGCHPGKAPATLATLPYLEETFGVWWVRGGLHRMTEALHARCVQRKVQVRTDTEVTTIERAGGRVSGVLLADGGRLDADIVITDLPVDPGTAGLLPGSKTPGAGRVPASSAVLELHLALRGRAPETPHRSYLFADDPEREPDLLFADRATPPADPTLCVLAPDDETLAPEGHSAWTVQLRVPRQGPVDWESAAVRDDCAANVLDLMARRGLDVRDRVLWSVLRTPADLAGHTGAPGGEVPGAGADGWRAAPRRVPNRSAVPGLFSVGASAHPGGGLTRVGMSAALVAELIGRA